MTRRSPGIVHARIRSGRRRLGARRREQAGYVRLLVPALIALVVSSIFLLFVWAQAERKPEATPEQGSAVDPVRSSVGTVLDARTGLPVVGATVELIGVPAETRKSGPEGAFDLDLAAPALIRVSAGGFSARVLAIAPGQQPRVQLLPRTSDSLSLRFGGDVMLGRRFYEPNGEAEPWLTRGAGVAQHEAPLARIAPLLGDADLTVVNLETSLVQNPYFRGARPPRFHPDKDLVFASAPATAAALKLAGVDVVDLGNNHVYDVLSPGLSSTVKAVEEAGLVHFGAGRTVAEAWRPAYVRAHGQRVAFIGCTTVRGESYPTQYVAGPGQGGAASCEETRMRTTVSLAAAHADTVVVMMHGGVEYQATQDDEVRALSRVAADAGATLVVNGHPHVVGGFTEAPGADGAPVVVAETMGNLLFDQNLWSTLRSYLLRVDLEGSRRVDTHIDPFAMTGYSPVPTTGLLADSSARAAAGLMPGPMLLGDGYAGTVVGGVGQSEDLRGSRGEVATVPAGLWLAPGQDVVTPGVDLLFGTGSFERMDTGSDTTEQQPLLWGLGKYSRLSSDAACSGTRGIHLVRQPASSFDVVAAPLHRLPVTAGDQMTLTAEISRATPGAVLEIRWYDGMAGGSASLQRLSIGDRSDATSCRQFRLDLTVPAGMVAVQPYLRLRSPGNNLDATEMLVDNVRLVRWSSPGTGGRLYDTLDFRGDGAAHLLSDG